MKKIILITIAVFMLLSTAGCALRYSVDSPKQSTQTAGSDFETETSSAAEQPISPDAQTTSPSSGEHKTGDVYECEAFVYKYVSHKIIEDYEKKPALAIIFEYTNNAKEAKTFAVDAQVEVYQDGAQLAQTVVLNEDEDIADQYTKIQQGKTIKTALYFSLSDTKTDVTLSMGSIQSYFNDSADVVEKIIKLA